VPTLEEALLLHREYGGLFHLDVKEPGLDTDIVRLLDRLDMWMHLTHVASTMAPLVASNPRARLRPYKAAMYHGGEDLDPNALLRALERPGNGFVVGDPRGLALVLGRSIHPPARDPVVHCEGRPRLAPDPRSTAELIALVGAERARERLPATEAEAERTARAIVARAWAAELLGRRGVAREPEARAALALCVRHRSLHTDVRWHGFDGAIALRVLLEARADGAIALAREVLWRDDPALAPLPRPEPRTPRSWSDYRIKRVVFPALRRTRDPRGAELAREYLALTDAERARIGPDFAAAAARALVAAARDAATAVALLRDRRAAVRGAALKECLARFPAPWARAAFARGRPVALLMIP